MLKGILGILLFIFFLIVFVMMLIGGRILKALRDLRKAAEQAAEKQAQRQRYETGRQRQQYSQRHQNTQSTQRGQSTQSAQQFEDTQEEYAQQKDARRTQTATGETIIDHQHEKRETQKIFDDSDGEYVDFVEER